MKNKDNDSEKSPESKPGGERKPPKIPPDAAIGTGDFPGHHNRRERLGDHLVELGFITEDQLEIALEEQKETSGKLGSILVRLGYLNEDVLLAVLGKQSGVSYISLRDYGTIPDEVIRSVPKTIAINQMIIPIKRDGNLLTIAISDPLNVFATDDLKLLTGCDIRMVVASNSDIKNALNKYYPKSHV